MPRTTERRENQTINLTVWRRFPQSKKRVRQEGVVDLSEEGNPNWGALYSPKMVLGGKIGRRKKPARLKNAHESGIHEENTRWNSNEGEGEGAEGSTGGAASQRDG